MLPAEPTSRTIPLPHSLSIRGSKYVPKLSRKNSHSGIGYLPNVILDAKAADAEGNREVNSQDVYLDSFFGSNQNASRSTITTREKIGKGQ